LGQVLQEGVAVPRDDVEVGDGAPCRHGGVAGEQVAGTGIRGPGALDQRDVDAVDAARPVDAARGDDDELGRRGALLQEELAGRHPPPRARLGEPPQHLVVGVLEEVEPAEGLDHPPARYSCTKCTAIDPSPTADATRFIDSLRTSPATNTPGRLVSSRCGGRESAHRGRTSSCSTSAPESTKPRSSRATAAGSQPVCGRAPMNTNVAAASICSRSPVRVSRTVRRSSDSSPWASATSVNVRTSMLGVASMWSIRYRDMLLASVSPR